jgi:hypothetical protein
MLDKMRMKIRRNYFAWKLWKGLKIISIIIIELEIYLKSI